MGPLHLLFDLDGTLTDPKDGITRSIVYALQALAVPVPPAVELLACIGPPLHVSFQTLLDADPGFAGLSAPAKVERVAEAVRLYRVRFTETGMYENAVFDGIAEALTELGARGKRLYVATSKPRVFAEQILRHFGLAHHFVRIHGSELDGRLADKSALIAHVLETEGISAESALMIGDREYDLIGARANGVAALAVGWGYGTEAELRAAGASYICTTPRDLIRAIE